MIPGRTWRCATARSAPSAHSAATTAGGDIVTHRDDISVLLNHGDGTFSAPASFTPGAATIAVASGDFNGDGRADLVTVGLALVEASPNPSLGPVTFRLNLPSAGPVRLGIYDIAGRLLREAWNQPLSAGPHTVIWDQRDAHNASLPARVYYYELQSGAGRVAKAMTVLR